MSSEPPPPVPLYMYAFDSSPATSAVSPIRPKRRQVKNACTHCQKACKKCDDARPCLRCVKYGVGDKCISSVRKQRKKGIRRGPYKKRDDRGRRARAFGARRPTRQSLAPATPPALPATYPPPPFTWYTTQSGGPAPPYQYYIIPQHVDQGNHSHGPAYYPVFHTPFPAQAFYAPTQDFISQVKCNSS